MKNANNYKWLIVVEGSTDVSTYEELLIQYGVKRKDIHLVSTSGKSRVCDTSTWNEIRVPGSDGSLFETLKNAIGRSSFKGVVLIVDSDSDNFSAFDTYKRNDHLDYIESSLPTITRRMSFCCIDEINGTNKIPIYGVNVPLSTTGCLETDLLNSYGFPIEGQAEYNDVVNTIKKASGYWQIPKKGDGKDWWEENDRAKFDKYIYTAFYRGFKVSGQTAVLPSEPDVIRNIKTTIGWA